MNLKTTGLIAIGAAVLTLTVIATTISIQRVYAPTAVEFAPGHLIPPGPPIHGSQGASDFATGHKIPPGPQQGPRPYIPRSDFAPGFEKTIPTGPVP